MRSRCSRWLFSSFFSGTRLTVFGPASRRFSIVTFFRRSLVIACFLGAIYLFERATERKLIESQVTKIGARFVLPRSRFGFVISIETHTFFTARALAQRDAEDARISAGWARWRFQFSGPPTPPRLRRSDSCAASRQIRWAALVLFALTIIKAMLVDIAELQQLYRIIVFFVLGVLVAAGGVGLPQSISFAGVIKMKRILLLFVISWQRRRWLFRSRRKHRCRLWPYYIEVTPEKSAREFTTSSCRFAVFDKAGAELGDLRLFDSTQPRDSLRDSHSPRYR